MFGFFCVIESGMRRSSDEPRSSPLPEESDLVTHTANEVKKFRSSDNVLEDRAYAGNYKIVQ